MPKHHVNTTLAKAIKHADHESLAQANRLLMQLAKQIGNDTTADALAYCAISSAAFDILNESNVRAVARMAREDRYTPEYREQRNQSAIKQYIADLSDEDLERNYYHNWRGALICQHELDTDPDLTARERQGCQDKVEMHKWASAEVERRGLTEQFTKNQQLRNENFDPERPAFRIPLMMEIAQTIAKTGNDQWGTLERICLRDLDCAMETNELELIDRERIFLDAVREYIKENGIKTTLEETSETA